ncbi:MAG: BatA and WFA domain-containing protein [Planctomycetota bacterium]|nr:BatA and WFA domain-containing protein [Planctomycetota bacterium]
MNWLNPGLVWFAVLAAVPVLLHFLLRERVQKVAFGAMRFLRKQTNQLLTRKRWLEWLLTAMRALAVLILAFAFARPFFADPQAQAASGTRPATVVVLDVSRSMSFGSRFKDAQAKAEEAVKSAGPGRLFRVVTFSDTGRMQVNDVDSAGEALGLIGKLAPTPYATDLLEGLDRVFAGLASQSAGGDVYLISDLPAAALAANREIRPLPKGFRLHVEAVGGGEKADGAVVTGGSNTLETHAEERNVQLAVRVANYGPARDATVKLIVKDQALDMRKAALPADGEAALTLTGTLNQVGEYPGEVKLEGVKPVLNGDDTFHFVLRVVQNIRVAVLNGAPSADSTRDAAYYAVEALNAGENSPYRAKAYDRLPDLRETDVVVLSGAHKLDAADVKRLDAFVKEGGGLLVAVAPESSPEAFNASIGEVAPARLRLLKDPNASIFLVASDLKHPWVRGVTGNNRGDLTGVHVRGAWELKDSQEASVILRFDDGRPALIEKPRGKGATLMFAACLDRRAGDFPLRAIYVPFVRECLHLLSQRAGASGSLGLGDAVAVNAGAALTSPAGKEVAAKGEPVEVTLDESGIYRLQDGAHTMLYAVNGAPSEADLTSVSAEDVERRFSPAAEGSIRQTEHGYERVLAPEERLKNEQRGNIGWWLLAAILPLTIAELLLARYVGKT